MRRVYVVEEKVLAEVESKYPNAATFIRYSCPSLDIEVRPPNRIISRYTRFEVLKRQKWCCNQCGCKLKYDKSKNFEGEVAHIDHIHPYSRRATYPNRAENINELANLQAFCPSCNLSKYNKVTG